MNTIEPLADVVTGGVLGRAVEPRTGVDGSGHTTERECLNCGTTLVGDYCHACGQKGHVHRTLRAFAHDLMHGVLHFEGKVFRTLPKLMFKPGELTRRYIAGERARFVSPLALFLFSVFTMFAVMSLLGSPLNMVGDTDRAAAAAEMQREQRETEARLTTLRAQRQAAVARGESTQDIDSDIREAEIGLQFLRDLSGSPAPGSAQEAQSDRQSQPTLSVEQASNSPTRKVNVGSTQVVGFQPGSAFDKAYKAAKQNPRLLIYKLQTNAYKFSWALIVISVPFMALLFLWRWRPFYDHAVFVTYSITAVSILVIAGSLLVLAGMAPEPVWLVGTLFIPWHIYRQLRGGYALRRFSALWRTFALLVFANVALGLFAFGLLMLGVLA